MVYNGDVDGATLKERDILVWSDTIENILKGRKIRSLNVRRFCVVKYVPLNKAKMVCQKGNEWHLEALDKKGRFGRF